MWRSEEKGRRKKFKMNQKKRNSFICLKTKKNAKKRNIKK